MTFGDKELGGFLTGCLALTGKCPRVDFSALLHSTVVTQKFTFLGKTNVKNFKRNPLTFETDRKAMLEMSYGCKSSMALMKNIFFR